MKLERSKEANAVPQAFTASASIRSAAKIINKLSRAQNLNLIVRPIPALNLTNCLVFDNSPAFFAGAVSQAHQWDSKNLKSDGAETVPPKMRETGNQSGIR